MFGEMVVNPSFEYIECLVSIFGRFYFSPSHTLQICIKRHIGNDDKNDDPGLIRNPGSKNVGKNPIIPVNID